MAAGTRKRKEQEESRSALAELPSPTSGVLQSAEGVPGRREVRGVCGGGRGRFYRRRRIGGIVAATLRIPKGTT